MERDVDGVAAGAKAGRRCSWTDEVDGKEEVRELQLSRGEDRNATRRALVPKRSAMVDDAVMTKSKSQAATTTRCRVE